MNWYRIFWLGGAQEMISSNSVAYALRGAGYGAGVVKALDFYEAADPPEDGLQTSVQRDGEAISAGDIATEPQSSESQLRAEVEGLRKELRDLHVFRDSELRTLADVEASYAELLNALKPFAAEADSWTDTLPDDYRPAVLEAQAYEPGMAGDLAKFTLGDLRRARLALTNKPDGGAK